MNISIEELEKIKKYVQGKAKTNSRARRKVMRVYNEAEAASFPEMNRGVKEFFDFFNSEVLKGYRKTVKKALDPNVVSAKFVKSIDWGYVEKEGIRILKPLYYGVLLRGAKASYKLAGIQAPFDVLNPEVIKAAEAEAAKLVVEIIKKQQEAIKKTVADGIRDGLSMPQIAKNLEGTIGLHSKWASAVSAFKQKLIAAGVPAIKANQKAQAYYRKLLRLRRLMIARTETAIAQARGSLFGYKSLGVKKVRFYAAHGACATCAYMDNTVYRLNAAFGVIPVHPNCRCDFLSLPPPKGYLFKRLILVKVKTKRGIFYYANK